MGNREDRAIADLSNVSINQSATVEIDVAEFADRVWAEYHQEQGHLSADYQTHKLVFVARDSEDMVIGMATGSIMAGVGHLSELLVDATYRGKGLGSALLEVFENRCIEDNCHKLTVHTERNGPARSFYEHRGWELEAIHYRDMAGLDYVRLVKFLDEDFEPGGERRKSETTEDSKRTGSAPAVPQTETF